MKDEFNQEKLYNEAFALIEKIKNLLLIARAQHERDSCTKKAA